MIAPTCPQANHATDMHLGDSKDDESSLDSFELLWVQLLVLGHAMISSLSTVSPVLGHVLHMSHDMSCICSQDVGISSHCGLGLCKAAGSAAGHTGGLETEATQHRVVEEDKHRVVEDKLEGPS